MRRRDWWLWSIGLMLAFFLAGLLVHRFVGTQSLREETTQLGKEPLTPFQMWIIFTNTVGYWPYVCITAQRWHDRNRPGWLAALWPSLGIPFFALSHFSGMVDSAGLRFATGAGQVVLSIGILGLFIAMLIDCGILDGTQGQNRYGPSPKGVGTQPQDVF